MLAAAWPGLAWPGRGIVSTCFRGRQPWPGVRAKMDSRRSLPAHGRGGEREGAELDVLAARCGARGPDDAAVVTVLPVTVQQRISRGQFDVVCLSARSMSLARLHLTPVRADKQTKSRKLLPAVAHFCLTHCISACFTSLLVSQAPIPQWLTISAANICHRPDTASNPTEPPYARTAPRWPPRAHGHSSGVNGGQPDFVRLALPRSQGGLGGGQRAGSRV